MAFQLCNFEWFSVLVVDELKRALMLGTSSGYSFVIIDCSYDTLQPKQFMVFRQTIDESHNDDRFQTMNH